VDLFAGQATIGGGRPHVLVWNMRAVLAFSRQLPSRLRRVVFVGKSPLANRLWSTLCALIGLEDKKFLPLCGTTGMSCGFVGFFGFRLGSMCCPFGTCPSCCVVIVS
jgi:hypothetical protein